MTLLGKVFMFIILLLSGIFFSLALAINASHTNWRDAATGPNGYQAQIKKLGVTIQELKTEIERSQNILATEQAARRGALASLQTQLSEAQGKLAEKEAELLKLGSSLSTLTDTLKTSTLELSRLTSENDEIKKLMDSTIQDRNTQRAKVISLTDEYNSLQSVFADAKAQEDQLRDENTALEARINIMRSTLVKAGIKEDPDDAPPEGLKGQVLAVGRENMVEVSIGRDDGVKVDHEFDVFRGAQYLGKIRILQTQDDKSIGGILPAFRKGPIQQGDKVAAKIR
jgi:chromosome segregation ATPase